MIPTNMYHQNIKFDCNDQYKNQPKFKSNNHYTSINGLKVINAMNTYVNKKTLKNAKIIHRTYI
jgi:hypothetical protein